MLTDPAYLTEILINGLLAGGVYALIAVTMTVVFGVLKLFNFAHGAFVTVGLYCAVLATSLGYDPYLAIVPAALVMSAMLWLLYVLLIDRIISRPTLTQVIFTIGLLTAADALIEMIWRTDPRVAPSITSGALFIGDILVSKPRLVAFLAAALIGFGFWAFLKWSWWGLAIRAVAQHGQAAQLIAIPRRATLALAFVLSGVATIVAGILMAPAITVTPSASYVYLGIAFGAVVIGTKGNVLGAMLGGIIVGLTEALTIALVGDEWKDAFVFALVLVFLLVRPEGLFGRPANV